MISLDRNYEEIINLSFVSPGLHLNTLNTEKMCNLGQKILVIPARGVKDARKKPVVHVSSFIQKTINFL